MAINSSNEKSSARSSWLHDQHRAQQKLNDESLGRNTCSKIIADDLRVTEIELERDVAASTPKITSSVRAFGLWKNDERFSSDNVSAARGGGGLDSRPGD